MVLPKYKTEITVTLLSSGVDNDNINPGNSEIKAVLTTTVIGKPPRTAQNSITVPDNQNFPFDGVTLASFNKTTLYLPVMFTVLVQEIDPLGTAITILLKQFDLETIDIDWTSGELFQIPGQNSGYKALLKFQVTKLA